MNGSSLAQPLVAARGILDRPPYLSTHRALSACTRELARLTHDVVDGVTALHSTGFAEKPVVRQTPGRCIVQLGPVALTIAWLRSTLDSAADGELLIVVWRGAVAPRGDHKPERAAADRRTPQAATALWEDVLVAGGESEALWVWQARSTEIAGCSSSALAAQCVERLRAAYALSAPEQ